MIGAIPLALLLVLALGCGRTEPGFPRGRLVDLSHAFDAQTVYWPTEPDFVLEAGTAGYTEDGYYYAAYRFRAPEHGGTHVDAPIHFAEAAATVDRIPLDQLLGEAVVIDVREACREDRDHAVTTAELRAWEEQHGAIPERAIVLLWTGFGARWPDRAGYLGSARRGPEALAELHFPGLAADAARWLVEERRIKAVGIDTASIDPGISKRFESHRALLGREVPAFENLANLHLLPPRGLTVIALPMKIRGGSGGPLRAIAIVPNT